MCVSMGKTRGLLGKANMLYIVIQLYMSNESFVGTTKNN